MKASTYGLIAAAVGAALLAPVTAGATDSNTWLQRQFSTVHRDPATAPARMMMPGAREAAGAGHAYAEAWLKRQLAGEPLAVAQGDGLAGRAGPMDREDLTTPLSEGWLRHQFTTDHPTQGSRY